MDPTIQDVQGAALFGDVPNPNLIDAQTLNPAATGPGDWTTVLTNGIANAAVTGVNGIVNNAVTAGQIANAQAASTIAPPSMSLMPLLIIGGLLYVVLK